MVEFRIKPTISLQLVEDSTIRYFILLAQIPYRRKEFCKNVTLRKIRMVYGIINATKDSINGI